MQLSCRLTTNNHIVFLAGEKRIKKENCVKRGKSIIKRYLQQFGLHIRQLTRRNDLEPLLQQGVLSVLCEQDTDSVLESMIQMGIIDVLQGVANRHVFGVFRGRTLISISTTELRDDTLYFETSCSRRQTYIHRPNYFLRAFALLHLLRTNTVLHIWGNISGSEIARLVQYHTRRGCTVNPETLLYTCDTVHYLNTFFESFGR